MDDNISKTEPQEPQSNYVQTAQPAKRPWVKPEFERMSLMEALTVPFVPAHPSDATPDYSKMEQDRVNTPLISVVMPVYNRELYLADAINSILAQTYGHFELIIVDDGSTDGSAGIAREFAARDARIRTLFLTHGGTSRARNAGIALAQGGLIAHADSDDINLPERFTVQLDWMQHTGVDICGSCAKRFGAEDGFLWFPETHAAIQHELLFRTGLLQASVMMQAGIAKTHPYDERASFDDYEIWTRLAPLYRMGNVPQVLFKYRMHERQSHVIESEACAHDWRKFGYRYFCTMFPNGSMLDFDVLARLAGEEPFKSLSQLRHAGNWLIRLAQLPDPFLRQRMAMRWLVACHKSATLGAGCYRLYQELAPHFGMSPDQDPHKLWLACILRLRP